MHPWNDTRGRLSAVTVLLIGLRLAISAPVHARQAGPQARAAGRRHMATTITQVPTHSQNHIEHLLSCIACPTAPSSAPCKVSAYLKGHEWDAEGPCHALRPPLVLNATLLIQVWGTFCSRNSNCAVKAAPPERAYVISLPQDSAKRMHMEQSLNRMGLYVETIDAIPSDQVQLNWGAALFAPHGMQTGGGPVLSPSCTSKSCLGSVRASSIHR